MSSNEEQKHGEKRDYVQEAMGNFGKWQLLICSAVSMVKVSVAWHQLSFIFLAAPQKIWCSNLNDTDSTTIERWHDTNTEQSPCVYEFDNSIFSSTIIQEWNLVGGREYLSQFAQMVYMLGILVGNFLFGLVADKYGRKNPLLISQALQVASGITTAFCWDYYLFLFMRFLDAVATGGVMVTSFVIIMEIVGVKYRVITSVCYHLPFVFGHATLSVVAYIFPNWRHFQLAISIPSIILLFFYWFVPESPRWLLTVGRVHEAKLIVEKAAKMNKLKPSVVTEMISQRESASKNENPSGATFLDLFRFPNLRRKTVCLAFNWLACGVCFFGIAQYMGTIGGNIFINVAAGGLTELPGSFLIIYTTKKFGRRNTLIASQTLTGISCLLLTFVKGGAEVAAWPKVLFSSIGIFGMSLAFPTCYLYSAELFPTVVRNIGVGIGSVAARVGSMAAPLLLGLDAHGSFIPPLCFGIFSVLGAALCFLLPETKNTVLPDTIEDGERSDKK